MLSAFDIKVNKVFFRENRDKQRPHTVGGVKIHHRTTSHTELQNHHQTVSAALALANS